MNYNPLGKYKSRELLSVFKIYFIKHYFLVLDGLRIIWVIIDNKFGYYIIIHNPGNIR